MVGVILAGAVLSGAGVGFASALRAEHKTQAETQGRNKLNLALDFIAEDIREALSVSSSEPLGWTDWEPASNDYQPVLYLEKPAIAPSTTPQRVVYYVVDSAVDGEGWRGSHMIYRSDEPGEKGFPLVDAIAASPTSSCTGGGTEVTAAGLKLFLEGSSIQVCLNGTIGESLKLGTSTRVFVRSVEASN
ncbi:hypothetical protein GS597_13265 [Synechococcales cyanobacterium C]|uniref:Uncharacterized protein n=2 Tax=Petrachloros TaxID=2918834 RepID=A0A8K2A903_9CYAN|nr:hypothetical protein [Petrachloros mirabilis ULC683]